MDSLIIARKLNEVYPEPKLIIDKTSMADVQKGLGMTARPLFPVIMPRIATIVTQDSEAYFREIRAKDFGMPLEELERTRGGEMAWADAEPGFRFLAELYGKENDGPFLMGRQPSFGVCGRRIHRVCDASLRGHGEEVVVYGRETGESP
ncbi:hypothetical protein KC345_g8122 [Hortaea werneckii]|nr:hypothetical protein KC345_g8122 [Hortaea werneckii]